MINIDPLETQLQATVSTVSCILGTNIYPCLNGLKLQVRSLRETVGAKVSPRSKGKEGKFRLFGMLGTGRGDPEEQAGPEEKYEDPADLRKMLAEVRAELLDQKEVNIQLKQYVGDVLVNIIAENPNILERQYKCE